MSDVRQLFDRGARRYDLLVALNPGYHRHLRAAARTLARRCARRPRPLRLLDLACGSGASTRALANALPDSRITGVDLSPGMLAAARSKGWPASVHFIAGEVGDLDVDALGPSAYDGVLAAYLFRNIPVVARDRALREVFTLLAPGGSLVVQDYSVRGQRAARLVWTLVCHTVIIPLGALLDGNPGLYRYLWRSVLANETIDEFTARLRAAGFTEVDAATVSGWQRGILHTVSARKPLGPAPTGTVPS